MGAAGDMLTAALLELVPDKEAWVERLNQLGIPGVKVSAEEAVKCGITGTHVSVVIDSEEEESYDHDYEHGHEHEEDHGHEHHHAQDDHEHDHEHHHEHGDDHEHYHEHEEHNHEHHHEHDNEHYHKQEDHEHDDHHHHHHHTHHHAGMHDIEEIVNGMEIPEEVKEDVLAVYHLIAEAESKAHNRPVSEIHFHEVGTKDAVADIAAVCLLMHELAPEKVVVSPVHVGSGHVHCAHGILPVPAPATAYILKDVPIYGGQIRGELCTPTGAALLKHFATEFGDMPVMKTQAIGYGMGKKDFEAANCVRVLLGESGDEKDVVVELDCNVDDMTGEEIGFAMEQIFAAGALEVFATPVQMKKSRPGQLLTVLCREERKEQVLETIFRHTTTIGIRETMKKRHVLNRTVTTHHTPYGEVHAKTSTGYGVTRTKYEYEDLSRIAREHNLTIREVTDSIEN
jgi:uncharacterized protein (TIGR00299 family) protein